MYAWLSSFPAKGIQTNAATMTNKARATTNVPLVLPFVNIVQKTEHLDFRTTRVRHPQLSHDRKQWIDISHTALWKTPRSIAKPSFYGWTKSDVPQKPRRAHPFLFVLAVRPAVALQKKSRSQ